MPDDKRLLRLAIRLHNVIRTNEITGPFQDLSKYIQRLQCHWREMDRNLTRTASALNRGWRLAARQVISEGRFWREDVEAYLKDLNKAAEEAGCPKHSHCTVQSIHDDLADLEEEFRELRWDKNEIWVRIEPITLEGVFLGPFEIRLPYTSLGVSSANQDFRIVALDPHPSGKREDITHPHVESGTLCMGDGTTAIGRALEEGRILDFFQLVHAILTTYNADSPYVKLENWEDGGIECNDCGSTVDEDESSYCEACQASFCQECTWSCASCSYVVCRSCSTRCPSCEMRYCEECTKTCSKCERVLCKGCVNEQGLCESCLQEQAQEGKTDDNNNPTPEGQGGRHEATTAANTSAGQAQPARRRRRRSAA